MLRCPSGDTMRAAVFLMPGWNEPDSAPLGEESLLAVTDGQGGAADSWISSKTRNTTAGHAREMETLCQAPWIS